LFQALSVTSQVTEEKKDSQISEHTKKMSKMNKQEVLMEKERMRDRKKIIQRK